MSMILVYCRRITQVCWKHGIGHWSDYQKIQTATYLSEQYVTNTEDNDILQYLNSRWHEICTHKVLPTVQVQSGHSRRNDELQQPKSKR